MEPDRKGPYGQYFRIKDFLIPQVEHYFRDLVNRNGPIRELIDSDYTFMNHLLGEMIYKQEVVGENLRKVRLEDSRRGGILTMPAVMTVTANGVDTHQSFEASTSSKICWEHQHLNHHRISNRSPDLRGIRSMQEQLAIHRDQQACNACHRRIDPMGIALETFDPIGRLRERYPKVDNGSREGPVIETSAVLASGREIKNVLEFQQCWWNKKTVHQVPH